MASRAYAALTRHAGWSTGTMSDLRYHRVVPSRRKDRSSVPQTSSNRIRAKDTSRAEARRRYRDEQRAAGTDSDEAVATAAGAADTAAAPQTRSAFAMPDVMADIRALPQVFRKPLVWLPFGMLVLAFVLVLLIVEEALPAGAVSDIAGLYVSLTLPPTALFVFFIGGFVAIRASYLVGALLGAFDALLLTILYLMAPSISSNSQLQNTGLSAHPGAGHSCHARVTAPDVGHRHHGRHPGSRLRGLVQALPALIPGAREDQSSPSRAGASPKGEGAGQGRQASSQGRSAPVIATLVVSNTGGPAEPTRSPQSEAHDDHEPDDPDPERWTDDRHGCRRPRAGMGRAGCAGGVVPGAVDRRDGARHPGASRARPWPAGPGRRAGPERRTIGLGQRAARGHDPGRPRSAAC